MWTRTLVLSLSSLSILATSFCAHNPDRKRDVSSTTLSNEFAGIEPLVVATDAGDQLMVYVKKHNSRSHAILVELSCRSNDHEPVRWECIFFDSISCRNLHKTQTRIKKGDAFFEIYTCCFHVITHHCGIVINLLVIV